MHADDITAGGKEEERRKKKGMKRQEGKGRRGKAGNKKREMGIEGERRKKSRRK